jgi:hypothetical protein
MLAAVGLGILGCPSSKPSSTGLEPGAAPALPTLQPAVPNPPSPLPAEQRYAGTYAFAGSDAERTGIEKAVDGATEGMVGKNIARSELMKRQEIRPTYTIRFDGKGNVAVETPGYPSEVSPIDGTEVQLTNKYGDVLQNRQRFVDGSLLQESRTHDGGGSSQFKLLADGNTLLVTRVSKSPKLPKTVQYTLTYRRQP